MIPGLNRYGDYMAAFPNDRRMNTTHGQCAPDQRRALDVMMRIVAAKIRGDMAKWRDETAYQLQLLEERGNEAYASKGEAWLQQQTTKGT